MEASKEFLKDKNILGRISFKESPVHTVVLEKDKIDTITGTDGNEVTGVQYLVKEDGEVKTFFTSSVSLVQKLSEYKAGDMVRITMKSVKGTDGFRTAYEVAPVDTGDDLEKPEEEKSEEELIEEIPF